MKKELVFNSENRVDGYKYPDDVLEDAVMAGYDFFLFYGVIFVVDTNNNAIKTRLTANDLV